MENRELRLWLKRMNRRSRSVKSKHTPLFPESAEREYARIANTYMKEFNSEVKAALPEIKKLCMEQYNTDSRMDGMLGDVGNLFKNVFTNTASRLTKIGLTAMIGQTARKVKRSSFREWKSILERTLGIVPNESYYDDDYYKDILDDWIKENEEFTKELIREYTEKLKQCVQEGIRNHKKPSEIARDMQNIMTSAISHAKQANKDQVSKLNTEIERKHCIDAGADKYLWMTKNDAIVRDCHRALHGKIFSWDDPPEMWHIGPSGARVMEGRFCHPGQDYRCRCIAIPIFDADNINPEIGMVM